MKVAVAIISDDEQRILITQRPRHASHGGYWEFPGGKLEEMELPEEALIREVKEELGIDVRKFTFLNTVSYQYPEYDVQLYVFHVSEYSGKPACLEGQLNMRWVWKDELHLEEFPKANHQIVAMIPTERSPMKE